MKKIAEYCIVEGLYGPGLSRVVKMGIEEGWQPLGGAFLSEKAGWVCQAMVKYEMGEDKKK